MRITELDDESRLDTMKPLAVVEPGARELEEFATCFGASAVKNSSVISPPFSSVITAVGDLAAGLSWAAAGATARTVSTSASRRFMRRASGG